MFTKLQVMSWIGECGGQQMSSLTKHNMQGYLHVTRNETPESWWFALFKSTYKRTNK